MGPSGRAAPANIVVDRNAELVFQRTGAASNREKRAYYYGDVPSALDAMAPFPSPKKKDKGKGRATSTEMEMDMAMQEFN